MKLRLPLPAVLALAGLGLSVAANQAERSLHEGFYAALAETAAALLAIPISSDLFLFVLLPVLLFHGAAGVDVRHLARDGGAILLLAIVAVFLSVGLIGGTLSWISGVPLTACLLLGTIIATTDPSAVISIFRELGAPARLTRLVEGEALLNDATAVAIFTGLLAALAAGAHPHWGEMSFEMVLSFTTGAAAGIAAGLVLSLLLGGLRATRSAQVTLTLATPYLVFAACHMTHLISGVVVVVASGITLGAVGRSRFDRKDFHFLHELLAQASDWATGLIFILAALVVPRILILAE